MPRPARYTAYGKPIQPLAEANHEPLWDREANREARRFIKLLLDERFSEVLRRGVHCTVTIQYHIQDGIIQQDITEKIESKRRPD